MGRLSGKKAKKGKKGKGKGNGKKPHIKTIDGVNPGGWLDGAQGSSEWDEDLQAIDDVTGDYVHDPFIDDVTGDYVAPLMTATSRTSRRRGFPAVVLGSLLSGRSSLWRRKPTFSYFIKKNACSRVNEYYCLFSKKTQSRGPRLKPRPSRVRKSSRSLPAVTHSRTTSRRFR